MGNAGLDERGNVKMGKFLAIIIILAAVSGCASSRNRPAEENDMKTLTILWQRLVDETGQTCERCGSTEKEVQEAFGSLRTSLGALGIETVLEKKALSPEVCAKDISQSNRIWVGGRPLEEWLGAEVGKSPCGFCCADLGQTVECRTLTVGGKTYEAIPAELIIKAGLLAGSQLVEAPSMGSCCPTQEPVKKMKTGCGPRPAKCQGR